MTALKGSKTASKFKTACDWHRADIVAALHKEGWSLRKLAIRHGYKSPNALSNALDRPWPKAERIIAAAIGIPPETIWPTRFAKRFYVPQMPQYRERRAA